MNRKSINYDRSWSVEELMGHLDDGKTVMVRRPPDPIISSLIKAKIAEPVYSFVRREGVGVIHSVNYLAIAKKGRDAAP